MKQLKKFSIPMLAGALVLSLAACGPKETGAYTPGTYEGSGQGYGGTVTVSITVDANAITDVKITGDKETPTVGGAALETLADQIKEKGTEIDGVAGATVTSGGVKEAATDALNKAKGKK